MSGGAAEEHQPIDLSGRFLVLKRLTDVMLSAVLLLLSIPIILFCTLLIRMSSHGPAFYSQTRLGRFGLPFRIWKLRTMAHNCEMTTGARWAMRNDPRVVRFGRFLRVTHLDELPQLWNVLKGDMSLVGPRPERPEFIPVLEKAIPRYRQRLLVRPGVTGVAQLYLPPDTGIASVRRKLIYDLYYIRGMGLWYDCRLMIATALQAIGLPCRFVRGLLLLPRPEQIEQPAIIEKPVLSSEPAVPDAFADLTFETRT